MPNVHHVTGPVREATVFGILAVQDEVDQGLPVDPVDTIDYFKATQYPPTIAHVLLLLRPAVEPASRKLPLAQPAAELLMLHEIKAPCDGESSDASKDLGSVGLCPGFRSIAAVKIRARGDVRDSFVDVDKRQEAQER